MATASSSTLPAQRQRPIAPFTPSAPSSPQFSTRHRPTITAAPGTTVGPTFKAPAHKHAHHLHSIPPREKSTRTLILDHLLWVHARTRLQQARAELGMTVNGDALSDFGESPRSVSTNGMDVDREPSIVTPFEHDALSDGEDVLNIKFGARDHERNRRSSAEDEHEAQQNLQLAHTLRLRADGVEKVLIAMLDQPPKVQPPYSDDDTPRTPPAIHGVGEHYFPNGVRLRLALSALVNDFFARDIPTPISPHSSNQPSYQARNAQTPSSTPQVTPVPNSSSKAPPSFSMPPPVVANKSYRRDDDFLENGLPFCLLPLAYISSFTFEHERTGTSLPSFSSFTRSSPSPTTDRLPPIISPDSSPEAQAANPSPRPRKASGRVLSLYAVGTDPATANSPPSLRCPRHLHHSCLICAPALPPALSAGGVPSIHPTGTSPRSPNQTRTAISFGSGGKRQLSNGPTATGLASWKTGAGIGAGLVSAGIEGTVLRRQTISHHSTPHPAVKDVGLCSQGGKLAELIPRFLRLSALVAVELGREAKEKEDEVSSIGEKRPSSSAGRDSEDGREEEGSSAYSSNNTSGQTNRVSALKTSESTGSPYLFALSFRPTHDWYGIVAGLLTRAVLEGYLTRGWKGPLGMECLLGVGLGPGPHMPGVKDIEEDEFIHLDPDDCPSLNNAARILFPNLSRQMRPSDGPEAAYEIEMLERISEFLTVPSSTPDLSTHFEDLAYKFPTEPVERAVIRFCEAVANWRGLPELANNRKPSGTFTGAVNDQSVPNISASQRNRSSKSPIDKYFKVGPPLPPSVPKRRRSSATSVKSPTDTKTRRPHFEQDEWTGPYGV